MDRHRFFALAAMLHSNFHTTTEVLILATVVAGNNDYALTITALAEDLEVPIGTVSRVATSLVERGWLTSTPHPDDRRLKVLAPTARVQTLLV